MQVAYSYLGESTLVDGDGREDLSLATSGGLVDHPFFYSGFLVRPRRAAQLLLSVSRVAATRFFVPAAMRDAVIRAADPVVTSDGSQLRFEAFSACTGVYARADLLPGAIDDGFVAAGTTNVDFNPAMRNALARVRDVEAVHLSVGADEITIATLDESVTERRVRLPDRWLRGFAEVQVAQTALVPRFELDRASTKRFLSTLARTRHLGEWWAAPTQRGLDLRQSAVPGAVRIAGLERLRLIANHARDAHCIRVWAGDGPDPTPTAWEVELGGSRLTLVLSPEVNRGFSGEGNVLRDVVSSDAMDVAEAVRSRVVGDGQIAASELATALDLAVATVTRALNVLASAGVAGYDLSTGTFFHRELPFGEDSMAILHPRLRGALGLGRDAVVILEESDGKVIAAVTGSNSTYVVRSSKDADPSCTCPWYEKHASSRGPCKHILALDLSLAEEP